MGRSYLTQIRQEPCVVRVSSKVSVGEKVAELLPLLKCATPILLKAGTGMGKTRAILEVLIPYAAEHGRRVCFVSSRAAINCQFKRSLAKKLGEDRILTDYTEEGLRRLEQIGPVRIMTYHALWQQWPQMGEGDFLVFDEIHALALDASFVPYTGRLLQAVPKHFSMCCRIYLSATPEPVLELLARIEGTRTLTIYTWAANYEQYRIHFYSHLSDVAAWFQKLPAVDKGLIFVPSIQAGEQLAKKIPGAGKVLCARTRELDPEEWGRLLAEKRFCDRFTIATNAIDAGVSITDPDLKHIVSCGVSVEEILQQAGRRRLKSGERINLYVWSPNRQKLGHMLHRDYELLSQLNLCDEDQQTFVNRFILGEECAEIRSMSYQRADRIFQVNVLALSRLLQEIDLLKSYLARKEEFPVDAGLCRQLRIKVPEDDSRWIDGRYSKTSANDLLEWLKSQVGRLMDKEAQAEFAGCFKSMYQTAYGTRKNDRADRKWGLSVIKAVLQDLNWGLYIESKSGIWRLYEVCEELERGTTCGQ